MSRTYRRKKAPLPKWLKPDDVYHYGLGRWHLTTQDLEVGSKEYNKLLAVYKSDRDIFKEPGPHWFRRCKDVKIRRKAKEDLHRYVQGENFEPIIYTKLPLDYWT